jgi:hypothetical protein
VTCHAGMSLIPQEERGEQPELELPGNLVIPKSMYGLSPSQMLAMGIAGDDVQRLQQNITEVRPCLSKELRLVSRA